MRNENQTHSLIVNRNKRLNVNRSFRLTTAIGAFLVKLNIPHLPFSQFSACAHPQIENIPQFSRFKTIPFIVKSSPLKTQTQTHTRTKSTPRISYAPLRSWRSVMEPSFRYHQAVSGINLVRGLICAKTGIHGNPFRRNAEDWRLGTTVVTEFRYHQMCVERGTRERIRNVPGGPRLAGPERVQRAMRESFNLSGCARRESVGAERQ